MEKIKCDICNKECSESEIISGNSIRNEIKNLIIIDYPLWSGAKNICKKDYDMYRMKYISSIIEEETGDIQELEKDVLNSINQNEIITSNINDSIKEKLTMGDRVADKIASFGGSWRFIFLFFTILFAWIILNTYTLLMKPFDPFPYILLNLILSCVAAIQAPVIMMSQNRQEVKDRLRSENDYKVNLKAEIEIKTLHEKVDHLLLDQWSKMMRIQQMQIEMLEEIKDKIEKK